MAYTITRVSPGRDGGKLTGNLSDEDRRVRLNQFTMRKIQAAVALEQATAELDTEITAARKQDQLDLIEEATRRWTEAMGAGA